MELIKQDRKSNKGKFCSYTSRVGKKVSMKHRCAGELCKPKRVMDRTMTPKGEDCPRCYELSLKKYYLELESKDFKKK